MLEWMEKDIVGIRNSTSPINSMPGSPTLLYLGEVGESRWKDTQPVMCVMLGVLGIYL
jgi:hypothetical protein